MLFRSLELLREGVVRVRGEVHQDVLQLPVAKGNQQAVLGQPQEKQETHKHFTVVDGVEVLDPIDDALLHGQAQCVLSGEVNRHLRR